DDIVSLGSPFAASSKPDSSPRRPELPVRLDEKQKNDACLVQYQDKDEQLNSQLQLVFNQHAQVGRNATWLYEKVAALLISWETESSDLNTKGEVDKLKDLLQETFNYDVLHVCLRKGGRQLAQVQINKYIADFLYEKDGDKTLLIVYYAGHGTPGSRPGRLELSGKRTPSLDEYDTVVWNYAESALKNTKADIFEIFDCCYAGDLGRSRGFGTRCFEFLGATSSGDITRSPGPKSFTTALMWALSELVNESGKFTTSALANKIREAEFFPKTQVPILTERNDYASLQRIVLAPLPKQGDPIEQPSDENSSSDAEWGFLDLKFALEHCPVEESVADLAKQVSLIAKDFKIRYVKWGGLHRSYSANDVRSPIVQEAVRRLLAPVLGRKAKGKAHRRDSLLSDIASPSRSDFLHPGFNLSSISHGKMLSELMQSSPPSPLIAHEAGEQNFRHHIRMALACFLREVAAIDIAKNIRKLRAFTLVAFGFLIIYLLGTWTVGY
ncbi:MAG: hypothetical protein Q9214_004482, partial [Letrouitia sp. 1 TL-2023]